MATQESSFGARLGKLQDMRTNLTGYPTYAPPREEDSLESLNSFILELTQLNMNIATFQEQYKNAVEARHVLFNQKDGNLNKLITNIRYSVEAQFGKNSNYVKDIQAIIKKMRGVKTVKESGIITSDQQQIQAYISQRSFSSSIQFFSDLISTLIVLPNYTTSIEGLSIEGLQVRLQQMKDASTLATSSLLALSQERQMRLAAYEDLKQRSQRIRAYIRGQYGFDSKEFRIISKLKI